MDRQQDVIRRITAHVVVGMSKRAWQRGWERGKSGADKPGLSSEGWMGLMVFLGVLLGLYLAGVF